MLRLDLLHVADDTVSPCGAFIISSSHDLPIAVAPEAYAEFDKRADGYTKVILKPHERK